MTEPREPVTSYERMQAAVKRIRPLYPLTIRTDSELWLLLHALEALLTPGPETNLGMTLHTHRIQECLSALAAACSGAEAATVGGPDEAGRWVSCDFCPHEVLLPFVDETQRAVKVAPIEGWVIVDGEIQCPDCQPASTDGAGGSSDASGATDGPGREAT